MVYTCLHMLNHHLWGWFSYWLLGLLRVRWSKNNNYPTKNNNRLFPWSFFMLGSQCQNVVPFRTANSQKMPILGSSPFQLQPLETTGFIQYVRHCSTMFDPSFICPQKSESESERCQSQTFPPSSGRSQALVLAGFSKERLPRLRQIHLGHVKVTASPLTIMAFWGPLKWCGYRISIKE